MKKSIAIFLSAILLITMVACSPSQSGSQGSSGLKIAFVPKIINQAWFDRMEAGVRKWSADNNIDVIYKGPTEADPAAQVQIITDLVAQKVDILCVVPLDPISCEPIFKRAMDQGIIVITHEAGNQQNCHYDVEAFTSDQYGAFIMDTLAKQMGERGKYITMVGTIMMASHNEWADGGVARQKAAYPNMELIVEDARVESLADAEVAYNVTKEMLKKYSDLRGIMGTTSFDVLGVARAVKEAGKVGEVFTAGSGIPSECAGLLKEGSLTAVTLWDPFYSAYAMLNLGVMIKEGKEVKTGMDLNLEGYHNMTLNGKVLTGQGWITITKDNVDTFGF